MRIQSSVRLRVLLPALLLAAACDSPLETAPVDQVPIGEAINSPGTARAALVGAYDALQSLSYYGRTIQVLGDLPADNAQHEGTFTYVGDLDRNEVQADNASVGALWTAIYDAVARVNLVLARVPGVQGLEAEERDQILGEAHFLRALHYHNLVKLWGDVPMPLAPVENAEEAAQFTRAPRTEVYAQVLDDLDQAEQLMSEDGQTRQASLGAVRALRARVLLYQENWAGALAAADAVLGMGYELAPNFTDLFTADGAETTEDIFVVSFTPQEFNELGWWYLWDGRWETAPTADLAEAFEAGDPRRDWTLEEDDGDLQGIKFPTTIGGEDVPVLRLAEVLLIKAEAHARLGQLQPAVAAYNALRERVGLTPHVLGREVTTQAQVLAAIARERRSELALEGDRWPDLVRTGRAVAELEIPAEFAYQTLFPIPAGEVVVAPGVTQNPGY